MALPFPFEPITALNPLQLSGEFALYLVAAYAVDAVYTRLRRRLTQTPHINTQSRAGWLSLLLAGPMEEMGFRGSAVGLHILLGWPLIPLLILANFVWAAVHKRSLKTILFVFVLGLFWTKLWMQGFHGLWWLAILTHSAYDITVGRLLPALTGEHTPGHQGVGS